MERGERGGKTDRESEREREKEVREREKLRGGKYRVKLHGHTCTYTDNLTCTLLVRLWRRMKELVPVQQTS